MCVCVYSKTTTKFTKSSSNHIPLSINYCLFLLVPLTPWGFGDQKHSSIRYKVYVCFLKIAFVNFFLPRIAPLCKMAVFESESISCLLKKIHFAPTRLKNVRFSFCLRLSCAKFPKFSEYQQFTAWKSTVSSLRRRDSILECSGTLPIDEVPIETQFFLFPAIQCDLEADFLYAAFY